MKAAEAVGEYLLKKMEVCELLRISRPTLEKHVKAGRIPPPIELSPQVHRWPATAIREVIEKAKEVAGYEQARN